MNDNNFSKQGILRITLPVYCAELHSVPVLSERLTQLFPPRHVIFKVKSNFIVPPWLLTRTGAAIKLVNSPWFRVPQLKTGTLSNSHLVFSLLVLIMFIFELSFDRSAL